MRKKILIAFFAIFLFPLPLFAADSTPSADIVLKLKEFQKEAASKAAQLKELITKRLQNKAYIGNIESVTGTTLTLSARSGPKMISYNQDTVFETDLKEKFSAKTLSHGAYIASLGDIDETGVLTAKKLVLLKIQNSSKTYLRGQIISVSDELVTLRAKDSKNAALTLPKSAKVKLNDIVILTGEYSENNIFKAGFVFKIATPSAR